MPSEQPKTTKQKVLGWLPYVLIPLAVYFGNVEVQSYLGQEALEKADLPSVPLATAMQQAKQEGKHILANMSAIWCSSCRKLDREVFSDAEVREIIMDNYVFTRIEYESEEGEAFMARYKVRGFPTLLLLDANGKKLRQLPVTFSPEKFIRGISET